MSSLALIVRGRAIDTYQHNGKTYVEGRKGTPYEIHFHNTRSERVKIIVSVDGLNVVTGNKTWDNGYVVDPHQTIKIPGWRKSANRTAEFEFCAHARDSYNQQNVSGEVSSIGAIGIKVYLEKQKPVVHPVWHEVHHYHGHGIGYYYPHYWNGYPYYNTVYSMQNAAGSPRGHLNSATNTVNDASPFPMGGVSASGGSEGVLASGGGEGVIRSASMSGVGQSTFTASHDTAFHDGSRRVSVSDQEKLAVPLRKLVADDGPMGTAWGKDHEFRTTKVEFDAQDNPVETFVIYYDSWERLKDRGVRVDDRVRVYADPDPFPDGCPPPITR